MSQKEPFKKPKQITFSEPLNPMSDNPPSHSKGTMVNETDAFMDYSYDLDQFELSNLLAMPSSSNQDTIDPPTTTHSVADAKNSTDIETNEFTNNMIRDLGSVADLFNDYDAHRRGLIEQVIRLRKEAHEALIEVDEHLERVKATYNEFKDQICFK